MNAARRITINSHLDITSASVKGREIARQLGFSSADQNRISLLISELARLLSWNTSDPGEIMMSGTDQGGQQGLQVACLINLGNLSKGKEFLLDRKNSILWRSLASIQQLADESLVEEQNDQQARVMLTKWRT